MKTRYTPPALAEGSTPDNDTLLGTSGQDTLDGGLGADTMTGLGGNDLYYVDNALDQVIEQMGGGIDTVSASVSYTLGAQVERLVLTGNANLNGTGNELNNILTGNTGTNVLSGGAGNDSLKGGGGADTLLGGDGNDTLNASQNTGGVVDGGAGTDTFVMDRASLSTPLHLEDHDAWQTGKYNINDVSVTGVEHFILRSGRGDDWVSIYTSTDIDINISTNGGDDGIVTSGGNATIHSGAGDDFINYMPFSLGPSSQGANWIDAGSGDDAIWANSDHDTINGGSGNDAIYGHGDDTINGGSGNDYVNLFSGPSTISETEPAGNTAWLWNNTGDASGNTRIDANASWGSVNNLVTTGKHFQFVNTDGSTGVDLYNIESFDHMAGTNANDLIFALSSDRSSSYDGGSGVDTFFYDGSRTTSAVHWFDGHGTIGVIGASNMERLLLSTGSGNDSIENSDYATNDDIRTNAGNDVIQAGGGNDSLTSGSGNDSISLSGADTVDNDWANAGGGDDFIYDVNNQDTVEGGTGYDTVNVVLGSVDPSVNLTGNTAWLGTTANGSFRVDVNADWSHVNDLATNGRHFQFINTDGSTGVDLYNIESLSVTGTEANDLIFALDNTGTYGGGAGTDTFFANWSTTTTAVTWRDGGIRVPIGESSSISVSGMERLLLSTGSGNDSIDNAGYITDDDIRTNAGNDTIDAGGGNDTIDAGDGNDVVMAGSGDDTITNVSNHDIVDGDAGTDTVFISLHGDSTAVNTTGNTAWLWNATGYATDNTRIDSSNANWTSLSNLVHTGKHFEFINTDGSTGPDLYNVENLNVTGSDANDLIFALGDTGTYTGGAGTDTFFADWSTLKTAVTTSSDGTLTSQNGLSVSGMERLLLSTGSGNDVILGLGNGSNDTVNTGAGNDRIDLTDAQHNTNADADGVNAGSGNDTIVGVGLHDTINGSDGYDQVDLDLRSDDTSVNIAGNTGWWTGVTIDANSSWSEACVLATSGYPLRFINTDGSVGTALYEVESLSVTGTDANDLIFARGDTGTYVGGAGTDAFFANWSTATTAVNWHDGGTEFRHISVSGMERLLLSTGSGNDSIDNAGYTTNDDIRTNDGNDTISAGAGNDTISAGAGDDTVYAGAGNDVLIGGAGNDLLIGGGGYDTLDLRDGGNDCVKLDMISGNDTVLGFVSGSDTVNIRQTLRIGDGDNVVDGGVVVDHGGSFAASAELVIFTDAIQGAITTSAVASLADHASSTYAAGQQALFVVDNGLSSQLYCFTSAGGDATVSASELTLLATLSGTAHTTLSDYAFSL